MVRDLGHRAGCWQANDQGTGIGTAVLRMSDTVAIGGGAWLLPSGLLRRVSPSRDTESVAAVTPNLVFGERLYGVRGQMPGGPASSREGAVSSSRMDHEPPL
jgi:hypothetical protein